ncbi:PASTA domain-containing protein [Mycolicibacterium sp. 3033]|nr:PASTA domain-containing protein [Mycolicibacterium aurantiacum]
MVLLLIVAWPYLLGTYIAVQSGAWNPSTERFVVGWCFEVVYIAVVVGLSIIWRARSTRRAAEEAQRLAEVMASGVVFEARNGRSLVYRHGTCTVNHRSHDTAARCNKSSTVIEQPPTLPAEDSLGGSDASRQAVRWSAGFLVLGLVAGLLILIADPIHSPAQDASAKGCPSAVSTTSSSSGVTVPHLVGQNAEVVKNRLASRGLANVELVSANPRYDSVWVASNWTVVSTDPRADCVVNPDTKILVYVTK